MRRYVLLLTVVCLVWSVALLGCSPDYYDAPSEEEEYVEEEPEEEPVYKYPVISWEEAGEYVGSKVYVEVGEYWAAYRPDVSGEPLYINLGADYPDPDRLQVVIWGKHLHRFDEFAQEMGFGDFLAMLDAGIGGMYIKGRVKSYDGVAQITLKKPENILPEPE